MKKHLLITSLTVLLLLSSCTTQIGWVGIRYQNTLDISYRSFNGKQVEKILLDEGQHYILKYDVICNDGVLTLQLTEPNGALTWGKTFIHDQQGSFEFLSPTGGLYTLRITGEDTAGGINLNWRPIK